MIIKNLYYFDYIIIQKDLPVTKFLKSANKKHNHHFDQVFTKI